MIPNRGRKETSLYWASWSGGLCFTNLQSMSCSFSQRYLLRLVNNTPTSTSSAFVYHTSKKILSTASASSGNTFALIAVHHSLLHILRYSILKRTRFGNHRGFNLHHVTTYNNRPSSTAITNCKSASQGVASQQQEGPTMLKL